MPDLLGCLMPACHEASAVTSTVAWMRTPRRDSRRRAGYGAGTTAVRGKGFNSFRVSGWLLLTLVPDLIYERLALVSQCGGDARVATAVVAGKPYSIRCFGVLVADLRIGRTAVIIDLQSICITYLELVGGDGLRCSALRTSHSRMYGLGGRGQQLIRVVDDDCSGDLVPQLLLVFVPQQPAVCDYTSDEEKPEGERHE